MKTGHQTYWQFSYRYAFRNLWRHKRRSLLTISSIGFAVMVAIVANRYSQAVMKLWQDGAADTGSAHVQIHAAGYWQKQEGVDVHLTLPQGSPFEQTIRADERVEAVVQRLELEGMISVGERSVYFLGKGVEPAGEMKVSPRLFTNNDEGDFLDVSPPRSVVVGAGLAEHLGLAIGDEVTLITQTVTGSVNGIDATVVGLVDAAIPSFSNRVVYAPIALFQRLIRMPGRYTELAIRLRPEQNVEAWVDEYRQQISDVGAEMRGWWEVEPIIRHVESIWDSVVFVITGLLFLLTGLSVLNMIFMVVSERTTEIGTLMAIGARERDIAFLFGLESFFMGLWGGIVGLIAGWFIVSLMNRFGVAFDSPFGAGELIVHPQNSPTVAISMLGAGLVICVLSAFFPARKASRVEPVRAFRGQLS